MDSNIKLYLERSENEIELAKIVFTLTRDKTIQANVFHIDKVLSFYSAVITHAYFSIFYGAKAYLLKKGITTKPPEEHKKTFEEFKKLTEQGVLDVELLKLYERVLIRADTLLEIFKNEKRKRGIFTYQELPQANFAPASESLDNAKLFFKHIYSLCDSV